MSSIRTLPRGQAQPDRTTTVHLDVNPRTVALVLLVAVFALLTVSLPLQWLLHQSEIEMPLLVVKTFDFDSENNLPTWLSSVMLLICAGVLFLIYRAKRVRGDGQAIWWAGLGLVFLYLSIDEAASLHEATIERMQSLINGTGALYAAWVVPVGIVLVIFGLIYLRFFLRLPRRLQGFFLLAAVLFVGGAMGLEMLAWHYRYPLHAPDPTDWEGSKDIVWAMLSHLEEVMEMVAVIIFLYALLGHLAEERVETRLTVASRDRPAAGPERTRRPGRFATAAPEDEPVAAARIGARR